MTDCLMQQEVSDIRSTEFRLQGGFWVNPELTGSIRRDHLV